MVLRINSLFDISGLPFGTHIYSIILEEGAESKKFYLHDPCMLDSNVHSNYLRACNFKVKKTLFTAAVPSLFLGK
jgi:hypothetical protein